MFSEACYWAELISPVTRASCLMKPFPQLSQWFAQAAQKPRTARAAGRNPMSSSSREFSQKSCATSAFHPCYSSKFLSLWEEMPSLYKAHENHNAASPATYLSTTSHDPSLPQAPRGVLEGVRLVPFCELSWCWDRSERLLLQNILSVPSPVSLCYGHPGCKELWNLVKPILPRDIASPKVPLKFSRRLKMLVLMWDVEWEQGTENCVELPIRVSRNLWVFYT